MEALNNQRILIAYKLVSAMQTSRCLLSANDQFDALALASAFVWTDTERNKAVALLARALPVTH